MAYRYEKEETGEIALVYDGWAKGIAPSPHEGVGKILGANISTEQGEIMCNYARELQSQAVTFTGGTVTQVNTNTVSFGGGSPPSDGTWITISASSIGGLANGNYYVLNSAGKLSATYSTSSGSAVTGMTAGTATWSYAFTPALPIAGASERYVDTTGVTQYRYYVLDANGRLWVQDTFTLSGVPTPSWFLPYTSTITSYNGGTTSTACGMTVYMGYVCIFAGNKMFTVSTSQLGSVPQAFSAGSLLSAPATTNLHFAFAGRQGRLYYTDGPFVGSVFADTSVDSDLTVAIGNVQSYSSYTSSTTTGTITAVLNGSMPTQTTSGTPTRIPAYFFPAFGGVQPTNLSAGTKYYIQYTPGTFGTFEVYAAQTGGAAINMATGASGTQYFNTFFPQSGDGNKTLVFSPQRLILPANEIGTCLAELGNTLLVGTQSNILYPWNQVDATPLDGIPMPEAYTYQMVTVNNVIYVFPGVRGNIYISNASSVSLYTKVPDYCSGLVEPYYLWGGVMYARGRVYFSLQDQTSTHTGQVGGVWSFIPAQNFFYGQDFGMAMRMEGKNSYNTLNGRVTVFIPNFNQSARGAQYFSAWSSAYTAGTFGIDKSSSVNTVAVIDTDIAPTGTFFNKRTFKQVEYKLTVPLDGTSNPETVSIAYRQNLSDTFTSLGTAKVETATDLSGYFPVNFQKGQWLQLQATLTSNSDSTTSFVRLFEIRVR